MSSNFDECKNSKNTKTLCCEFDCKQSDNDDPASCYCSSSACDAYFSTKKKLETPSRGLLHHNYANRTLTQKCIRKELGKVTSVICSANTNKSGRDNVNCGSYAKGWFVLQKKGESEEDALFNSYIHLPRNTTHLNDREQSNADQTEMPITPGQNLIHPERGVEQNAILGSGDDDDFTMVGENLIPVQNQEHETQTNPAKPAQTPGSEGNVPRKPAQSPTVPAQKPGPEGNVPTQHPQSHAKPA